MYLVNLGNSLTVRQKEQLVSGSGGVPSSGGAVLTVGPKPGTPVTEPTVRLSEVATSSKLSLLAYEQRFHPSSAQVPALLQQVSIHSLHIIHLPDVENTRFTLIHSVKG